MSSPTRTTRRDTDHRNQPLRVVVAGGYGFFGTQIVTALAREPAVRVIVAGRNAPRARQLAMSLGLEHAVLDVTAAEPHIEQRLSALETDLVVDATGAIPPGDYRLVRAALRTGASYLDISDSRRHVCDVRQLDGFSRARGLLAITGASSVPALSSAVIDAHAGHFAELQRVAYGITASEVTPGSAAVASVLRYCGKPFASAATSQAETHIGWQDGRLVKFHAPLGWRWLARCDIPDLELFPERYPTMQRMEFRAGVAMFPSMLGMWSLSWLVRLGVLRSAVPLAPRLHRWARHLEPFGSGRSGMYIDMEGVDHQGHRVKKNWQLVASDNDGPSVPAMGAVALTRKIARSGLPATGAMPCMGMITLDEYLQELAGLNIQVFSS